MAPISIRIKFINLDIDFGNVIKLFERNFKIFKLIKRPKFAGKNSKYVSFKYNSFNDINDVMASGKRCKLFKLKSKCVKCLYDFILSGSNKKQKQIY